MCYSEYKASKPYEKVGRFIILVFQMNTFDTSENIFFLHVEWEN